MNYKNKIKSLVSLCILYPMLLFSTFIFYLNKINTTTTHFQHIIQNFSNEITVHKNGKTLYISLNTNKNKDYLSIWKRIVKTNIYIIKYSVHKKIINIQAIPEGWTYKCCRIYIADNLTTNNPAQAQKNEHTIHKKNIDNSEDKQNLKPEQQILERCSYMYIRPTPKHED